MNAATHKAIKEAAPAFDTKIIPVMREAITTVQMVLFQKLKESIPLRHPGFSGKDTIRLAGAVVNSLYGTDALDHEVNHFARQHRELIEKELRGLCGQLPELIPHITDSLRMQTLCDNQEGVYSIPSLLLAKELGLLDETRELPMPSTFMLSVRKLGERSGLVKAMHNTSSLPLTAHSATEE
jgi:hypothetical protein